MASLVLDAVLVLWMIVHLGHGWRTGILAHAFDLAGYLVGVVLGLWLAPRLIALLPGWSANALATALALVAIVLTLAALGEVTLGRLGRRLRSVTDRSRSLRVLDRSAGAVASLVIIALTSWFIGTAVKPVVPDSWAKTIDGSLVLRAVDPLVPAEVGRLAGQATAVLDAAGFPRVFSGLGVEPNLPTLTPDAKVATTAAVQAAASSIVKIQAQSTTCRQADEGSGWVVAAGRVVTNAHVVGGSTSLTVQPRGTGTPLKATVVAFDPRLDLAILAVPGLSAKPLARAGALASGTSTVVAGFPLDGPYRVGAASVLGTIEAVGDDIYGTSGVTRQVYAVQGTVQPGNSGGPLLTSDGKVAGTVFARSLTNSATGYALTDKATDKVLDAAASDTSAVSTGACVQG